MLLLVDAPRVHLQPLQATTVPRQPDVAMTVWQSFCANQP